jgi:hypothetical protein
VVIIDKIGMLIELVTTSVRQFNVDPHSPVVARVGDDGQEMQIEQVRVQQTALGPKLVLQLKRLH